jgi:hypothetical protein
MSIWRCLYRILMFNKNEALLVMGSKPDNVLLLDENGTFQYVLFRVSYYQGKTLNDAAATFFVNYMLIY